MERDFLAGTVCNLCQSENIKIIVGADKYPDSRGGDIVRCGRCGLVFRYFQGKINAAEDRQRQLCRAYPANLNNPRKKLFKYCRQCVTPFRKYNRILDVGSGHGYFLSLCRKQGWMVSGAELNPKLARFSKSEFGIDVINKSFAQARYPQSHFDVVTLWNVLEHLEDPYAAIKKIYEILRPGGAIFIKFANADVHVLIRKLFYWSGNFWRGIRRFDGSCIGMFAFSRITITRYLLKAGFQSIFIANARPNKYYGEFQDTRLKAIKVLMMLPPVLTADFIATDRNLLASSLLVRAIKP